MSKLSNEQKLAKIIDVKNAQMLEATTDLRAVFSILKEVKDELAGDISDEHTQSISDALLTATNAFMTLLEAQIVEKYWDLES